MKTKHLPLSVLCLLGIPLLVSLCPAADITALTSGNWSDATIWSTGTVPGADDDVDVPGGITVTVDTTNATVMYIYDSGTVQMAPNSTLIVTDDTALANLANFLATAPGSTVMYKCNPYSVRLCDYFNLVLNNTNYVDPNPPYNPTEDFNNFTSGGATGPTAFTVYGDMILMGFVKVEEANKPGYPITIKGDLKIGAGCAWDSSSDDMYVYGNVYIYGLLEDLDAASGTNWIGGNVIVCGPSTATKDYAGGYYTNGWFVSDVTSWGINGSLTNNGAIYGRGYGSIFFNGAGSIAGSNVLTLPTMTINGTYAIADSIRLTTNNANFNGTLIFDLANTNQITLVPFPSAGTTLTNYYGGNLIVQNTGPAPMPGKTFQLFSAAHYTGAFAQVTLPALPAGLNWVNDLLTAGSLTVGGSAVQPSLAATLVGNQLRLSWDSGLYPGYSVQAQTNHAGLGAGWTPTGSGTTSPYNVTIDPANPAVFYRLSNP